MAQKSGFKGNKAALPSKACVVCGREMTWRKSWAKNWADVKYCSDACRAKSHLRQLEKRRLADLCVDSSGLGNAQTIEIKPFQ